MARVMKICLSAFIILQFLFNITFAQIDSTDWYPLQIGNKWFYMVQYPFHKTSKIEVIGDTIMPNNLNYFILNDDGYNRYQRRVGNNYVYEYNKSDSTEFKLYDFISPDRTIWNMPKSEMFGIRNTIKEYDEDSSQYSIYKIFEWVWIDSLQIPIDTIWGSDLDYQKIDITKGLGINSFGDGFIEMQLYGAIINGKVFGKVPSSKLKVEPDTLHFLYPEIPNEGSVIKNIGNTRIFLDSVKITSTGYWSDFPDSSVLLNPSDSITIHVHFPLPAYLIKGEEPIVDTLSLFYSYEDTIYVSQIILILKPEVVSVTWNNELPVNFSLSQNYPNPFNPATTIKYSIPVTMSPVTVSLKVFNLLGQEVATLVNKEQPAGNYEVKFDASNLASGVYLYQLKAGSFTQTKKMVYLR